MILFFALNQKAVTLPSKDVVQIPDSKTKYKQIVGHILDSLFSDSL